MTKEGYRDVSRPGQILGVSMLELQPQNLTGSKLVYACWGFRSRRQAIAVLFVQNCEVFYQEAAERVPASRSKKTICFSVCFTELPSQVSFTNFQMIHFQGQCTYLGFQKDGTVEQGRSRHLLVIDRLVMLLIYFLRVAFDVLLRDLGLVTRFPLARGTCDGPTHGLCQALCEKRPQSADL